MISHLPWAAVLADRYRVERELGSGGMAIVFLAHDLRHNRRVEEQAVPSERVPLQRPGPQVSEPPLGAAARQTQTQPAGHAGGWSAVAPLPGLNITHITDEVVRQLDSRLIAARERFGHV